MTQRFSSLFVDTGGTPGAFGFSPANIFQNVSTFQRIRNTFFVTSSTAFSSKRFGSPGWFTVKKYQRMTSAPYLSIATNGSTTLPFDFDIFWPLASSTWPRQMTFLYGGVSLPRSVDTASSV